MIAAVTSRARAVCLVVLLGCGAPAEPPAPAAAPTTVAPSSAPAAPSSVPPPSTPPPSTPPPSAAPAPSDEAPAGPSAADIMREAGEGGGVATEPTSLRERAGS